MRPSVVIETDPVCNNTAGVCQAFEAMAMSSGAYFALQKELLRWILAPYRLITLEIKFLYLL